MVQKKPKPQKQNPITRQELLPAVLAAGLCFVVVCLVWLAAVRPNAGKSLSQKLSDDYTASTAALADGQSVTQTFLFDEDLLAMGFVFSIPAEQPTGELALTLADADTGEILATSTGEMGNILPGQYTGLGLSAPVAGVEGRHYAVTLTPHYTGSGTLALGCAATATLWEEALTVAGAPVDSTLALLITYRQIGGFLTRWFLLVGAALCALVFFGVWQACRKELRFDRLVLVLVLGFGLLYSLVLPPYAAPDEKYHINQSFTLACRWANAFSAEEWRMGDVPLDTSYRRTHDFDALLQDENTTVFTWQEFSEQLFTTTTDSFDSHVALDELQTDNNPLPYLPSAAVVLLCFVLHLGFVPTLFLGRLVNLLLFALLAAAAVRAAPFGKRVFAAAALLPMTLHLAASFSRDSLLLGLCFAFTALCLDAVFGAASTTVPPRRVLALAAAGLLLAPAKVVYLPLAALALLIPAQRLGRRPVLKKAGYLAACVALALLINGGVLRSAVTAAPATEPETTSATAAPEPETQNTAHSAPTPQSVDAAAEALPAGLLDNTAEAFVRRLFYFAEANAAPAQAEVDFWVQALNEGDVTPALLGQSFFFSPALFTSSDAAYGMGAEDFLRGVGYAYLGRDILTGEDPGHFSNLLKSEGETAIFKALYTSEEARLRFAACGLDNVGTEDAARYPLSRETLRAEVEAARAVRASQSVASAADSITYTPGYILTHLPDTAMLLVRSVLENGDHYLRSLVGGSLSYYSLNLAWGWVLLLYLLLAFAAMPAASELDAAVLPRGRYRVWCAVAALGCCALTVAGCIVWTPTYYETIYGLQGRYFLPVLPLLLVSAMPRVCAVRDLKIAAGQLVMGLCVANAGVLLNSMLAVIAR